jgi:Uma2 family endonuclease
MSTTTRLTAPEEIEYPETDGEPMAENTVQYDWITKIKGNLERIYRDDPNVFIAGDLFWYPVEKDNKTRRAPDVLVAIGRPKGPRQSYLQWLEGGLAPQVVWEILSPSNRGPELALKFDFYERYGVEEYYIYDPDFNTLEGWLRENGTLRPIEEMNGWVSPRLGIRFELSDDGLRLYRPDGQPFLSEMELDRQADEWRQRADDQKRRAEDEQHRADEQQRRADVESRRAEEQQQRADEQQRRADAENRRADDEKRRAEEAQRRAERLAAQLKALGIEPEP